MDPNIKAVRYYDGGYRLGILVRDDEKRSYIIPIAVGEETRVIKYRTDIEGEVVTEYLDGVVLKRLVAKVTELGKKYGITEEAKRWLV